MSATDDNSGREASRPLCPSAQPNWPTAKIIGVVGGTPESAEVAYLEQALQPTDGMLGLAAPLDPTEVFRFTAPCVAGACAHFGDGRCRLASKIITLFHEVTSELPPCSIRPECRWWRQEGPAACRRCPQIVTRDALQSLEWQKAADPLIMPETVS
jgi:hypothetical protein